MKRAFVYRYYRKPMPSCNWCPRIELAYDAETGEFLVQAENNQGEIFLKLRKLGYQTTNIVDPFGEVELTPSQFKIICQAGES